MLRKFKEGIFSFRKAKIFSMAGLWSKFLTHLKGKRTSKMRRLLFAKSLKNRLLFEDRAKRCQVSSCLVYFPFFCVKQSSLVLIFGSFYQEKEQVIQVPQCFLNSNVHTVIPWNESFLKLLQN